MARSDVIKCYSANPVSFSVSVFRYLAFWGLHAPPCTLTKSIHSLQPFPDSTVQAEALHHTNSDYSFQSTALWIVKDCTAPNTTALPLHVVSKAGE